jgi:hypothetical protein
MENTAKPAHSPATCAHVAMSIIAFPTDKVASTHHRKFNILTHHWSQQALPNTVRLANPTPHTSIPLGTFAKKSGPQPQSNDFITCAHTFRRLPCYELLLCVSVPWRPLWTWDCQRYHHVVHILERLRSFIRSSIGKPWCDDVGRKF